ncbi:coiled-coil domain-containing protein 17, partial [Gracilinanus agilis]|uniref:coiled-coil domain-containing protein 17 n=1 Tax=Gracilinanus agilis TaxID=191870 RepID=UPI001CFE1AF3
VQRLRTSLQGRRPPPKAPPGAPAHLQEAHARRLAEIGAQAQSLEKLRAGTRPPGVRREPRVPPPPAGRRRSLALPAEVGQQLGSLAGGSGVLAQLMLAMQAHEERTQLALDALGDRVERLQARTPQGLPAGTKEDVAAPLGLQDLPASGGNLTSEIRALHTAYLQAGGRDPAVLAGVGELYLEAALLEGRPQQKRKARAGPRPPDTRLQTLDALNGQLEAEILALQIQRGGRRALQ